MHAQIEGVGGKFAEQKDGIEPSTDGRDRLNRKEEEGKEDRKGVEKERRRGKRGREGKGALFASETHARLHRGGEGNHPLSSRVSRY